ncbi:histidinol-phosphate transaminase [Sulfuriroseicoccus oceanibius]|uniref:Histidinol-phosphate aminotransferase n=1 Tax=Sulfuriroseicoccus oceanibius TaxID=2707525 RepID=A0A6B3L6A8_9BACT|nr:histidinol-phosphate transaminase [Sulfuriroseicoccus oceanibius]QQL46250.1 histidinol-phosphate transaminase [Sulfuriroseicoccus oceanibius]
MNSSIWDIAHPQLRDLVAYEPGKPIDDVARDMGLEPDQIVKLASNENPLGPSPKAIEAMADAVKGVNIYPDGAAYHLRNAIADKFDLKRENVVLGCGSNEIIELLGHGFLKPGTNIVTADHAFVVYKLMATLFGAETKEIADPGFVHDLDAMAEAIDENTREVFIANPNNPTGTLVDQEAIDRFMEKVPDHVIVVFDEAYYEFLDTPPDTLKYVREGRNVVVLRTFSKIQGLAGTRTGYGLMKPELAEVLQKCRQPFNTNMVGQAGALAGLLDEEHQQKTKALTDEGREFFQQSFEEMGLEYVPSFANFVLVKVGDGDKLFAEMMKKGVIVRAMRGYKLPEWVRISIGTMDENRRCIEVMKELLGK